MKEKFVITGGKPLSGIVNVSGAKNAAVGILPATILAKGECVIDNIPMIADVMILLKTLKYLGAEVEIIGDGVVKIDTTNVNTHKVHYGPTRNLRASYYFIGALLAMFGDAETLLPGGCAIGTRPIDQHLKGFRLLGANVQDRNGKITAHAEALKGREIYLDVVSVGATINIMLAAVKAKGNTTIINAAKEPHIVDVANFLNCMGAKVKGAGTDVIKIQGVENMHGCNYSIIPDQIEAGTLMIAAAATQGDVVVNNIIPTHMDALSAKLLEMGVDLEEGDDYIRVRSSGKLYSADVKTMPYPGFPTDLQQPITVLLSTAEGTSIVVENLFESRFKHIEEIRRMGAKVMVNDRVAVVEGVDKLTGAPVTASDLRAGASLVVAGLMAEGVTEIYNIKYIDRGYDGLDKKLVSLGADIKRERIPDDEDDFSLEL